MSNTWRERWNERYSSTEFAYGEEPNYYLKTKLLSIQPTGSILFAAEGEGRNAVFAAKLGWKVSAFDISIEGKNKAEILANKNQVIIDYKVGELNKLNYPKEHFDAVALIYAHFPAEIKSQLHQELIQLLKQGGYVIFEAFSKKHYDKLLQKFDVNQQQLRKAIDEIEKLNPKPGGSFDGNQKMVEHVVPDFTIRIMDGELELLLNGRNAPELHVSKDYQAMLQSYKDTSEKSNAQKDAVQFIKQKLDSAKWFIDAIKQRQETLYVTMNAIMYYQQEYFLEGEESKLRPMILKDTADMVGLDISTVSRVANSKYVDTPYGTKLIKEFFSESMTNDQGEEVSTIEIKNILQQVISEEDKKKPLPDDQLAEILKEKGYPIARRTIAKYREQLDIPVARLRKKI